MKVLMSGATGSSSPSLAEKYVKKIKTSFEKGYLFQILSEDADGEVAVRNLKNLICVFDQVSHISLFALQFM